MFDDFKVIFVLYNYFEKIIMVLSSDDRRIQPGLFFVFELFAVHLRGFTFSFARKIINYGQKSNEWPNH